MATESAPTTQTRSDTDRLQPASEDLLRPGRRAHLLARLRRHGLDRALSEGADPTGSVVIAARVAQLSRICTRVGIAIGLERLALSTDGAPHRAWITPSRAAIGANRSELLRLATLLRAESPLYVRGIAILRLALTDGTGPVYTDRRGEALARQLELAQAALVG